ncbi:hypothetical protein [Marivirga arenosa]|uniref:Uncharacterized protein n=1 Tax=Marivirga arenosa TaxID=3059076 RepID=A0AA49GE30_9BACT|nr:hypothetical protein [Marivirga sp. BKB1-2]WKK81405.1 hypothetical protein QYS47_03505 [Marivirga sp. BKB1-2]
MKGIIPTKRIDHYFFPIVGSYYLVTALLGFGYSTANRLSAEGVLPFRVIVHGLLGGIWYAMFFLQVILIAAGRKNAHMKLGSYSVPIMILVFISSIYTVLLRDPISFEKVPFSIQGFEIGLFTIGLIYVLLGYIYRYRAHHHKRYYLMSIVILSGAGINRFYKFIGVEMFNEFLIIFFLPLLLIVVYDLLIYRRLFKASWIGILLFVFNMLVLSRLLQLLADYLRPILKAL